MRSTIVSGEVGDVQRDVLFFFFQAEDGIRDADVTGVQTCALPISGLGGAPAAEAEGIIAGEAVARSLDLAPAGDRQAVRARAALRRHRRFQSGLWTLFAAPRLLTELASPATVIC